MTNRIAQAYLLANPRIKLKTTSESSGQRVHLPAQAPDPAASVVVLKINGAVKSTEAQAP
jgi:hypothetical protein